MKTSQRGKEGERRERGRNWEDGKRKALDKLGRTEEKEKGLAGKMR